MPSEERAFTATLSLSLLQTYVRVVETGNISAAARSLYLAQSAVSAQLAQLSRAVGAQLLERVHGRWESTAIGSIVYERARQMLQTAEMMRRDIDDAAEAVSGHIVIASTRTVTDTVLPKILAGFYQRHPDIRVEVVAGNRSDAERRLAADDVDIALVALPFGRKGLEIHPFGRDRLLLVVPREHPLGERTHVLFEEIASERFVIFEEGAGTRSLLEERLGTRFSELDIRLALNSNDALVESVLAGLGVTFLPERVARRWESLSVLHAVELEDLDLTRTLAAVLREGVLHSQATQRFLDFVMMAGIEEFDRGASGSIAPKS